MRVTAFKKSICTAILFFLIPLSILSATEKVVRVGFSYDGDFMYKDSRGRYCGYEVEYIYNVAQLAGWTIQFVDIDDINELDSGKIDMLCGLVRTPERESKYLFSDKRMGATYCTLLVKQDNRTFVYDDITSFKNMKTGMERNTFVPGAYESWCKSYRINPNTVLFDTLDDAFASLKEDKIGAVAVGGEYNVEGTRKIAEFEPVDFYIALPKDGEHEELKTTLDSVMVKLLLQDPLFELQLHKKYFGDKGNELPVFSQEERMFIHKSGNIKVAVLANDEPYSSIEKDGSITGIIPEYYKGLTSLSGIAFKMVPFETMEDATKALQEKRVSVIGLYCNDIIEAGYEALNLTKSYTLMNMVQIEKKETSVIQKIGVPEREKFIVEERIPNKNYVEVLTFKNSNSLFEALKNGTVDAILTELPTATWFLNHSRVNEYIISSSPAYNWEASSVLNSGNTILLNILNKTMKVYGNNIYELYASNAVVNQNNLSNIINRMPMYSEVITIILIVILIFCLFASIMIIINRAKVAIDLAVKKEKTELKEIEIKQTEKATEERERFLCSVSYDMRTPLTCISGFTELAQQSNDFNKVQEYLSKIKISNDTMLDLINDTLTVSYIMNGNVTINKESVDNLELLDFISFAIKRSAQQAGVDFKIDISSITRRRIITDRAKIKKIFYNLLSNAVKFTPRGGHVLFKIETVENANKDIDTIFSIQDDGIGMSEAFMSNLYKPFVQEHYDANKLQGFGLGLYIAKQMITVLGGSIDVESEKGKGTTFTVKLRFDEATDEKVRELPIGNRIFSTDELKGKRILLCDDNNMNVEITKALLEEKGIVVTVAHDGKEAVKLFERSSINEFAIVLMDLRMPEMNGFEATQAIRNSKRKDASTIQIIALSADAFDDDIQKSISSGMNGHIAKPIVPETLYAKLAECIVLYNPF